MLPYAFSWPCCFRHFDIACLRHWFAMPLLLFHFLMISGWCRILLPRFHYFRHYCWLSLLWWVLRHAAMSSCCRHARLLSLSCCHTAYCWYFTYAWWLHCHWSCYSFHWYVAITLILLLSFSAATFSLSFRHFSRRSLSFTATLISSPLFFIFFRHCFSPPLMIIAIDGFHFDFAFCLITPYWYFLWWLITFSFAYAFHYFLPRFIYFAFHFIALSIIFTLSLPLFLFFFHAYSWLATLSMFIADIATLIIFFSIDWYYVFFAAAFATLSSFHAFLIPHFAFFADYCWYAAFSLLLLLFIFRWLFSPHTFRFFFFAAPYCRHFRQFFSSLRHATMPLFRLLRFADIVFDAIYAFFFSCCRWLRQMLSLFLSAFRRCFQPRRFLSFAFRQIFLPPHIFFSFHDCLQQIEDTSPLSAIADVIAPPAFRL